MRTGILTCSLLLVLATGCNETHDGTLDSGPPVDAGGRCDPCEDAVQLRIMGVADPDVISVAGADLVCMDAGSFIYCGIRSLPPGEYTLTVSAPGFTSQDVFFMLSGAIDRPDCDPCQVPFTRLLTLRPE